MAAVALSPDARSPLGTLPSWKQTVKLARYQLRDYLFSRRFVLMVGIVAAIGAILTTVVGYYRPSGLLSSSAAFYAEPWGMGITVIIVFAGVIFGGDAIAGEFQNKTGYFLMGLPLRRATVYAGKYLAAFAAALTSLLLYAAIVVGNAAFYFGGGAFTLDLAESLVLSIVYLLALLGATFLFSSLFKTSTYAVLVVAVLFLFGFTIIQDLIVGLTGVTPWFILTYADTVISGIFNTVCTTAPGTHTCSTFGGTTTVVNATIAEGAEIMLGYFFCTVLGGLVLFEREEFT